MSPPILPSASSASPSDQAEGLRQMFAHARPRFVPVVSNPHVAFGGVMLERLCTAFGERGVSVLVVDAGERAREAGEMAMVDLAQCIERLSAQVSFLAGRGLPVRFVDASGSTRGFLRAAADAAPQADAVLVHGPASDLCRLFARTRPAAGSGRIGSDGDDDGEAPIVLADDRPASVTHAYAAMKLLSQRAGLVVFDLLLGAAPQSPRAERIAARLTSCADTYFGAVLRCTARIDPSVDASEAASPALRRIAAARFEHPRPPQRRPPHTAFGGHAGNAHP